MKKLAVSFAAAFATAGIIAGYLWQQLHESRGQVATLQARLQTVESAQQTLAPAPATQLYPVTSDGAPPQDGRTSPVAAPGDERQAATQRPGAALLEGARQVFSSQAGRDMVQPAVRGMVQQRFKGIGKALQLSPDEEDKLLDTLARQQMDLSAASMDLLAGNVSDAGSRRELERKLQEMQRANEGELASLLGGKYAQFQEFESTMAARQQVDQLNAALATSGGQLSEAQGKSLVAALAAEQKRITQEANANPVPAGRSRQEALELQVQRTVEANRRLVDAASRHLDSQQLDSYRKMLDQQAEMLKRMLGAMGGAG